MKRYVKASTEDALLTSRGGNFKLCTDRGVGIHDTPWTGYRVVQSKLAAEYVVSLRLNTQNVDWGVEDENGDIVPVELNPRSCYISYGIRSVKDTVADIQTFIRLLEEAIEFKYQIDDYFSSDPKYYPED